MKLDIMKLKIILAEREMNQKQFAELLGIHCPSASKILSLGTERTDLIGKIAHALDVPVESIVNFEVES